MKRIIRITGITLGMALLLLAVACSAEGDSDKIGAVTAHKRPAAYKRLHDGTHGYTSPMMSPPTAAPQAPAQSQDYKRSHGRRASTP